MKGLIIILLLAQIGSNDGERKIGFGFGQTLGEHLLTPSLFTMRIKSGESFYIAPEVNFNFSSSEDKIDSHESSTTLIGVETNIFRVMKRKERTRLYGIFGVGFERYKTTSKWYVWEWLEGENVKVERTNLRTTLGGNLGLGFERFLTSNLSLNINSISNFNAVWEKTEEDREGEKETLEDSFGFSIDFQNLKCCIYLIWYM